MKKALRRDANTACCR